MTDRTKGKAGGASSSGYPMRAVEALFNEALARPSGTARESWLRHAAGGDAGLLTNVRELLEAHQTSAGFLERSALLCGSEELDGDALDASALIGAQIGPYRLVEELGEGGFGTVFRAEQLQPVRRQVALKVIKLGMDTRQVIARFEAERQALALMDHPSIARVLDAGSTETGRPYFVMDLAPGIALTKFCDSRRLSIEDRLHVFLDLCSAVQHAHQRGVIHRDLKPSNVLVAEVDGRIVPKVIDFGIAKATGEELTEDTLFTEQGQVIGTPVYMSPEQATGRSDIDTRADVFSLGVILYELVAGSTPMRIEDLRERAAAGDVAVFLREFEAPAPSTRLSKSIPSAEKAAIARGGSVAEIRKEVKGDLDHVILCALENERDRRYESAAAFARDVQRVLESRPIEASPPSSIYRTQKFLRRHRVAALASAAVVAALLSGVLIAVDSLRAKRDQGIVLRDIFSAATAGGETTGEFAGSTGAKRVDRRVTEAFGPNDEIRVDALATFADRLTRAGDLDGALEARSLALDVAVQIYGESARPTAFARAALGLQRMRSGQRTGAMEALRVAIDTDRDAPGDRSPALNEARLELARLFASDGSLAEAEALAAEADEVARTSAQGDGSLRAAALELLVELRMRRGDTLATREAWNELLREYGSQYSEGSTFLARKRVESGRWLADVGRAGEAAAELRAALSALDTIADAPAELQFDALSTLNRVYTQERTLVGSAEARALLERELEAASRRFDPGSSEYFETLARCANQLLLRGDLARSTELLNERFKAFVRAAEDTEGAQRAKKNLAEELAERADLVRRQDGLDPAAYVAARESAELALPYKQGDPNLLESRVVLAVRVGDFTRMFGLLNEFETSSDVSGEHPLTLAMEAIAWYQAPGTRLLSRDTLRRAENLARQPQFVGVPGLQETLRWAHRVIEGEPATTKAAGRR